MPEPVLRSDMPRSPVPAQTAAADYGDSADLTALTELTDLTNLTGLTDLTDLTDLTQRTDPTELEQLDRQLIAQLIRRAHRARGHQLSRRAAGLPATTLAQENAMLQHYAARLGEPGTRIALAILDLSRPPTARPHGHQARGNSR
ncbi:hypothetical protein [Kitasatospora kifunensis]|uniref:Chorismate mutase n=1 Tax=Kitasatospora kifunensis TaxID=58351 RepID=A0A7W7R8H7_KITKI|nr:hypothetical protein [Kitasatospora kifunensis]MBB4927385.1 chorismate mutase [Kitasatospora kifunensis]